MYMQSGIPLLKSVMSVVISKISEELAFCQSSYVYLRMHEIWKIILVFIASFLTGSIPTAWLILRSYDGRDLRDEGSGNIGTMNAYEVSRSRFVGVIVLVIDVFKGAVPLLVLLLLPNPSYLAAAFAMVGVVLGHNYSPWIGWKGGRGLAAALGAGLLLFPVFALVWGVFWLAAFVKTRHVHVGNIAATVLAPFTTLLAPGVFNAGMVFHVHPAYLFPCSTFVLATLILLKHVQPMRELLSSKRRNTSEYQ